jgi:hypothetical protein
LRYHLGAALAHRNAFYDLAGGDQRHGSFQYPTLVFDTTIEILKATSRETVVANACSALQRLSDGAQIEIELESAGVQRTLRPQADPAPSSGVVAT